MNDEQSPVVLELAPLPREQTGPFLLLGLDKDAGPEQIEAHWAKRVIGARKNQIDVPLEDINWARETLNDPDRRARADAGSLNADIIAGVLRQLAQRYSVAGEGGPTWPPLDVEKPLADYTPPTEVPDPRALLAAVQLPEAPAEEPAAAALLEQFVREPLDPWAIPLPD